MDIPIVELKNISFSYRGDSPILNALSFQMYKDENVVLLGESGSGKSTLLRLICGLETPDAGDIRFNGNSIVNIPTEKRGIGLLFQNYNLFPHIRIADNVAFGLSGKKSTKRQAALSLLRQAGLERYAQRYPHELSGGEQQRVALLRALILSPGLMLLDEPFSNLDAATKQETAERTFALLQQNSVPVIMVTHNPDDARQLTRRLVTMEELKNNNK